MPANKRLDMSSVMWHWKERLSIEPVAVYESSENESNFAHPMCHSRALQTHIPELFWSYTAEKNDSVSGPLLQTNRA